MKRLLVGLAAIAAMVLVPALGLALAPVATAAAAPPAATSEILLPASGWHGRAVREPHGHDTARTSAPAGLPGWSAGPAELGTGSRRAAGSRRVREVQERLRRLGYATGPVDGIFGRRTRAAVGWFQRKHGLPIDGRATAGTVRHLRARTGAAGTPAPSPAAPDTSTTSPGTSPATPGASSSDSPSIPTTTPVPARDAEVDGTLDFAIPILVLIGLGLAAAGFALARNAASASRSTSPVTIPVGDAAPPARTQPGTRAIGYVRLAPGAPGASFHAQAAAIEAGCLARGLDLVSLVSDREPDREDLRRPPALAFAVDRLGLGLVDRLVITRLDHLARSEDEARGLVATIAGRGGALVVLDRDLDTGGLPPADAVEVVLRPGARPTVPSEPAPSAAPEQRRTIDTHIFAMLHEGLRADEVAAALNAEPVPPPEATRGPRAWAEDDVRRRQAAITTERPHG